jgi:hypothetical protein
MSSASEGTDSIDGGQGRHRESSRVAREGAWFALLVSGLVVLIAVIFYDRSLLATTSPGCQSLGSGFSCSSGVASRGPFGSGLGAHPFATGNASPWVTTYWVVSIFLASCAVVAFYWFHSRTISKRAIIWPFPTLFIAAAVLITVGRGFVFNDLPGDMIVRGMQALLLVALGLVTVAIIARSWTFSIFVAGFIGLALLSCLYNVSNLFQRIGVGASNASSENLPNLILPAVYLFVGAGAFLVLHRFMIARDQRS